MILGSATTSSSLPYQYTPAATPLPSVAPQAATAPGTVTAFFAINGVLSSAFSPTSVKAAVASSAITAMRDAIASGWGAAAPDASLFSALVNTDVSPPQIVVRWTVYPVMK